METRLKEVMQGLLNQVPPMMRPLIQSVVVPLVSPRLAEVSDTEIIAALDCIRDRLDYIQYGEDDDDGDQLHTTL